MPPTVLYFLDVAYFDTAQVNVSLPIHPSLRRAYEILEPLFLEHIITDEVKAVSNTRGVLLCKPPRFAIGRALSPGLVFFRRSFLFVPSGI